MELGPRSLVAPGKQGPADIDFYIKSRTSIPLWGEGIGMEHAIHIVWNVDLYPGGRRAWGQRDGCGDSDVFEQFSHPTRPLDHYTQGSNIPSLAFATILISLAIFIENRRFSSKLL